MPVPNISKFPRTDMAEVPKEHNPFNAWTIKVKVENVNEREREEGLLHGQRIVLKVGRYS